MPNGVVLIGYEEWENIGLRSIAAFLIQHGCPVRIVPFEQPRERILTAIREEKPSIVGFSLIFQRMLFEFAGLLAYLREQGITAHFTMGGHFPTIDSESVLTAIPELDSVVRGEGEETLLALLHCIDRPGSWAQIAGLAFKQNGTIVSTAPRPLILDLDSLPYIIRKEPPATHRGLGLFSMLGSRGCFYDCSFCSIHEFYSLLPGPRRRSRSPAHVVDEMEYLFKEHGARIFVFEDDDIFMKGALQRQWIQNFLGELRTRRLANKILWRVSCRIDDIDPEMIRAMMDAGLMSVYLGIESGSDEGLHYFNKHYSVREIQHTLDVLRNLSLPFEFGFMILHPYSNFSLIKEDIRFLKEIGKDGETVVVFTKMIPYAGTKLAEAMAREGRLQGTLEAPDYTWEDDRLGLFQLFLTRAFHDRNWDPNGLSEHLRLAKFDVAVVRKFYSHIYDAPAYEDAVKGLIRRSNEIVMENMSMVANFMAARPLEKIIDLWQFVEMRIQEEQNADRDLAASLNQLLSHHGWRY